MRLSDAVADFSRQPGLGADDADGLE